MKHFIKCSRCGKLSGERIGEYKRSDGTCGYINHEMGDPSPVCTDCRELEPNRPASPTDAEMLDWLEKNASVRLPGGNVPYNIQLRAAIAAAMREEGKQHQSPPRSPVVEPKPEVNPPGIAGIDDEPFDGAPADVR